jgi:hypothetical protein
MRAPYHNSHDQNFDVKLDPAYQFLNSDANHVVTTDRGLERWMEMEWEVNNFPPFLASDGDRVWMMGRWVFDCGHPPYETEIHPPFAVAFTREEPTLFAGDWAPSLTNKTYFYVYGRGGYYNAETGIPAMRLLRNYEFDIALPAKPSPASELVVDLVDLPFGGPRPILVPIPGENRVHVVAPLSPPTVVASHLVSWDDVPGQDSRKLMDFVDRMFRR